MAVIIDLLSYDRLNSEAWQKKGKRGKRSCSGKQERRQWRRVHLQPMPVIPLQRRRNRPRPIKLAGRSIVGAYPMRICPVHSAQSI
eukprot:scaffold152156_cov39-Prasinocladus_malaysianus.AAC.1